MIGWDFGSEGCTWSIEDQKQKRVAMSGTRHIFWMVGRLDSCSTQLNGHQVRFLFHSKTKKKKLGNRKFIHLFYPKVSTIILNTVQFETWGAFDHKHSIYISRLLYFVKLEMLKNRPLNRNADNAEINFRTTCWSRSIERYILNVSRLQVETESKMVNVLKGVLIEWWEFLNYFSDLNHGESKLQGVRSRVGGRSSPGGSYIYMMKYKRDVHSYWQSKDYLVHHLNNMSTVSH
jgi:hypothetical protein